MIFDKIENLNFYKNTHPRFKKAFEWIESVDLNSFKIGEKIEIDGSDIYAKRYSYTTFPETEDDYEGHKKYIDIQIMLSGSETIYYAFLKGGEKVTMPYKEDNDKYKVDTKKEGELLFSEETFVIFFPQDLHKTSLLVDGEKTDVIRTVLKVRVD